MKKEEAKPTNEPIDYSAFKGEYVKIISGEDKVEYSAKVINLYNGKLTLNLADGNERILSLAYVHSINRIDKPIDFKLITRIETKKRNPKKKKEAWMEEEKKGNENEEKDDEDDSLEGLVSKDE
jgi:hypothetical protein